MQKYTPSFDDQGINKTVFSITNIPQANIAELSNIIVNDCEFKNFKETKISLNQIDLNFCDFINLFYGVTSGAFIINPSCSSSLAISLTKQTYSSTQSKTLKFNLYDQILKAYSKNENVSENATPLDSLLNLERETFLASSLINVKGKQIALSLDEVLDNLINRNLIENANDVDSYAKVKFIVTVNYYYPPLSVKLSVAFNYVTDIPGYKNTSHISYPNVQCHYSKNENITKQPHLASHFSLNSHHNDSYFLEEDVGSQHLKNTVSFHPSPQIHQQDDHEEEESINVGDDDSVANETIHQLQSMINGDGDDQLTTTTKENAPW